MEAKFNKRLIAYIIDITLLGIIMLLVSAIIPDNNNIKNLNMKLDNLNEQYLNNEINTGTYLNQYSNISYNLDKENIIYTIINIIFIVIYFIIIPFFYNGQTIGKKLLKIKVIKENGKLTIKDLIIRNIIINGLGFILISLILIYLIPALGYFIITLILSIVQLIVIIITMVAIIKSDEHLGLHDKITNTKVVNLWKNTSNY